MVSGGGKTVLCYDSKVKCCKLRVPMTGNPLCCGAADLSGNVVNKTIV